MKDFEEARQASIEDMEAEMVEETPVAEEEMPVETDEMSVAADEVPVVADESTTVPVQDEQTLQLAETAARAAQERDMQLQALAQENEMLKQTMQQQSQQQEEEIVEEVFEPPVLDFNSLMYDDEEAVQGKIGEFSKGMYEYTKNNLLKELQPQIEHLNQLKQENEKTSVINSLSNVPELKGFKDMLPQIESLIDNNPLLKNAPTMQDAYINAYAIARGAQEISKPETEMTPEQVLELLNSDPEAQKLYEQSRLEKLQGQQVPPFSASSGAVNAALDIPQKPTTLEEARKRTEEMFRIKK